MQSIKAFFGNMAKDYLLLSVRAHLSTSLACAVSTLASAFLLTATSLLVEFAIIVVRGGHALDTPYGCTTDEYHQLLRLYSAGQLRIAVTCFSQLFQSCYASGPPLEDVSEPVSIARHGVTTANNHAYHRLPWTREYSSTGLLYPTQSIHKVRIGVLADGQSVVLRMMDHRVS